MVDANVNHKAGMPAFDFKSANSDNEFILITQIKYYKAYDFVCLVVLAGSSWKLQI